MERIDKALEFIDDLDYLDEEHIEELKEILGHDKSRDIVPLVRRHDAGSSIEVTTDGETMAVGIHRVDDVPDYVYDVAWQAPDCSDHMFKQMAMAMAIGLEIPIHYGPGVPG